MTATTATTLTLGAVAYDPKVVTIWDGFARHFGARGLSFDYVLFTSYERQVESHLAGQVHVAWNSPLAWLQTQRAAARLSRSARAIAMRDTDQDLASVILVREAGGPIAPEGLRGKRVGVGASDSPQATLIPLEHLASLGLVAGRDLEVVRHDALVGKHGDHIGGERDAVRALLEGRVDAACILDANLVGFARDGTLKPGTLRVVTTTPRFDHCCFTTLDDGARDLVARFVELLFAMKYEDPEVRGLMDMEGLKAWRPGRTSGFALLAAAVDRPHYLDAWLDRTTRS
jgi:phosphonate transport system substrate-binding protein